MKCRAMMTLGVLVLAAGVAFASPNFPFDFPFPENSPRAVVDQMEEGIAFVEIASSPQIVDFIFLKVDVLPQGTGEGDILSMVFLKTENAANENVVKAIVQKVESDTVTLSVIAPPNAPQSLRVARKFIPFDIAVDDVIFFKFQPFMTLEQWRRLHP